MSNYLPSETKTVTKHYTNPTTTLYRVWLRFYRNARTGFAICLIAASPVLLTAKNISELLSSELLSRAGFAAIVALLTALATAAGKWYREEKDRFEGN